MVICDFVHKFVVQWVFWMYKGREGGGCVDFNLKGYLSSQQRQN